MQDGFPVRSYRHTFIASGRVPIDELNEEFELSIPEGDYDTVAGYLLECLGSIPVPKEEFDLGGLRFIILQATANRIDLVCIVREEEGFSGG